MENTPKDDQREPAAADTSDAAIGRRLREAREAKGMTQQQVSVRSKWSDPDEKGVSRTAIVGYESGSSRPGTRELRILCEALHVTPNHLIYGSEHPFQTAHAALEGLRTKRRAITAALQVAFLVMALRDHERDALLSLANSLGGHTLGDERLAGLKMMGHLLTEDVQDKIRASFSDLTDEQFADMPLTELAQRLSREVSVNVGTKLKFNEDGEIVGGEQLYPDPEG